jgi:peptidoglycan/xylan/chitin deacetylase (PgdA/CDA1 family)
LQAGLQPVYWSAWGEDWEDIRPERIADFAARDLSDGVVILLHDSARYAHRPSARATAAAIPLIAAAVADAHLIPRPISSAPG